MEEGRDVPSATSPGEDEATSVMTGVAEPSHRIGSPAFYSGHFQAKA